MEPVKPTAMDALLDAGRIRGASRMIPEATPAASVTKEIAQKVIDQVASYKKQNRLSLGEIGKAIGYGGPTISQVLSWKYEGDWRQIVLDLDRWLEDQIKRDAAPKDGEFVWTSVAQEIKTVADSAITLRTIGLVYGPTTSGIGKTMALQAIAAEKPGSIYISVEKVAANTTGLLKAICAGLGIGYTYNNAYGFEKIKNELYRTPRLLLVDQIHSLRGAREDKPLYVLTELQDKTKAPQLWCGTSDIVSYLSRGEARGNEPLAQIRRRIGISRDLMERTRGGGKDGEPLFTIEEIRQVFGRNKMRLAHDAAQYLYALANVPNQGALGTCRNVVLMAILINEARADVLTAAMLRSAHRTLVNGPAYSILEERMKQTAAAPQPVARAG